MVAWAWGGSVEMGWVLFMGIGFLLRVMKMFGNYIVMMIECTKKITELHTLVE
jgi:hypothetical protein